MDSQQAELLRAAASPPQGRAYDFLRRVLAPQAAGALCAIEACTSPTLEQISTRHREINTLCDQPDALAS